MKKKVTCIFCMMLIVSFLPTIEASGNVLNSAKRYTKDFDIQGAIDNSSNGDIIIVPDGTYPGEIDFKGMAITVMSENGPANCIIDGDDTTFGVKFENNENSDSILHGFTITNCRTESICGAGIFCDHNTSPTIDNCIISENTATDAYYGQMFGGGGVYCGWYSSPSFNDCIISNNLAESTEYGETAGGGGVLCGRFCTPTFTSCEIINNLALGGYNGFAYGGGVCGPYASPEFLSCLIANNSADISGGIDAHACGGGLVFKFGATPVFKSCMIIDNVAQASGGGLYIRYSAHAIIDGCTFSGNKAFGGGEFGLGGAISCMSSASAYIRSSIFWDDYPKEIYICGEYGEDVLMDINYSDIQGGEDEIVISAWYPNILKYGKMNLVSDPCFINSENGDYHLQLISPCVDAGEPNLTMRDWAFDFDMEPREYDIPWIIFPLRGPMDIGADEIIAEPAPELSIESITGGFGVTSVIKNIGYADATNITLNITIEGGLIIKLPIINYEIESLEANESMGITMQVFGIGLGIFTPIPEMTIGVECDEGSKDESSVEAKIFFILVTVQ